MSNNYRLIFRPRRRYYQLPLFITPQNYEKKQDISNTEKNNSIDKTDNTNLKLYTEYLSKIKTYNLKILELTDYYLKNPIDRSDYEFCQAFYEYSNKCIIYLERTCYQKEDINNTVYDNNSHDNYMFDPFTIMENPLDLHLSAFVSKNI
jgi:hypothetical protein